MSKNQLKVPDSVNDIADRALQVRIRALYSGATAELNPIRNRMIDEFVRMAVKPNNGIIDITKAPDLTSFFNDFKVNIEKASSKLVEDNNLDKVLFAPLIAYAKETVANELDILKNQSKAEDAVITRLKERTLLQFPVFVMEITENYLQARAAKTAVMGRAVEGELPTSIPGTNLRSMDPDDKNTITSSLASLRFPTYNISNVLKNDRALDQDIAPIIQTRMKEFFGVTKEFNAIKYYVFDEEKFAKNKEKFIKEVESDLAIYEVGLEYIAQLQKENPSQIIDDIKRKEILNALNITLDRNNANNLAQIGGKIPQNMLDKMNSAAAGYDMILSAMKEVGGNREYPDKEKLIAALLPKLAEVDPTTLKTNHKAITKFCAQAISKYSSKSIPLFGNNTVTFKFEELEKMRESLKISLEKFPQNPKPNVAKSDLLPAGMPTPVSEPVVDRAKVHISNRVIEPKPPLKPFPEKEDVKSNLNSGNQKKSEFTPVVPFEKWEESELQPHGMPPRQQLTKPIPSTPQAVPIKPKSLAKSPDEPLKSKQSESPIQKAAPKAKRPVPKAIPLNKTSSAIVAPGKPQSKQDTSAIKTDSVTEKPKASISAASKSSGENPILEAEKKQLKEIEGWKSSYKELGFTMRRSLSARPESSNNLGQSLKEWRQWYKENKTKLDEKKFAVPLEYKDVMSKLQIAQDLDKVIGKVYNEEDRIFAQKIKNSNDDVARYTILQKEAENKRASRGVNSKSVVDIVRSNGEAQEHDSPRPPATKKSTKVEELHEKRRKSRSNSEGIGHS